MTGVRSDAKALGAALALLGALLLLPGASSGHALAVHQEITRDAGLVWAAAPLEVTLHLEGVGAVDPLGTVHYSVGDDTLTKWRRGPGVQLPREL
jgi:hypothetical protein